HVMNIINLQQPKRVLLQFAAQTPINLPHNLPQHPLKILPTSLQHLNPAHHTNQFQPLLPQIPLPHPQPKTATSPKEPLQNPRGMGYPLVVPPSY
ncbi:hypothetical protein, partial [Staphylococcus epidermidis]|uniref:hypothetical protein n=1 Tax=Staphylococcus epidermidis TaxID=1282 RepID=UPI001C936549